MSGSGFGESFRDLTVVIPTLNEAEAIGLVIDEITSVGVPRDRILVVDGHSNDGTDEIAQSKGVRVIYQKGRGKADAIRTALEAVDSEYILLMDGDWTYPARYIPVLYEKARNEGLDLVIGARKWGEGSQGLLFRFGNRVLTWFFNLIFGTRLRDVLSGMYIVRREALRGMSFNSKSFGIESEIAAHVASTTGRVGEVEIEYRRRLGRKKLGVRHGFRIAWDMIRLSWSYNPAFLFFLLGGILLLLPGLTLGGYTLYRYYVHGVKHYVKGVVAVVLTATGIVALLQALQSLFMKRMEFRIRALLEPLTRGYPTSKPTGKEGGSHSSRGEGERRC